MELTHTDLEYIAQNIAKQVRSEILAEMVPGKWMTLTEAMEYAKVKSENTMIAWINDGFVYGFKAGGKWKVDRESIDNWFLSERV